MSLRVFAAAAGVLAAAMVSAGPPAGPLKLDAEGERWVAATLKKMTLDDKVGQLLVSSFQSKFTSTESSDF